MTRKKSDPPLPTSLQRALLLGLLAVTSLGSSGCATLPGSGGQSLSEEIEGIILAPPLDQVHWGILIVDAETGQTLYARSPRRKFVPASNMKVLSTSTALSLLGPDFRLETELWTLGRTDPTSGRLEGDLLLTPSGDPTFSERFYPSATAPFDTLAQTLWNQGIRSVSGTLIVDAAAWDSTTVPGSWMVGNLAGSSSATGGALAVAEGVIQLEVTGGSQVGDPASVRWWPDTPQGFLSTDFVTAPADSSLRREAHYLPESHILRIQGRVPRGRTDTISVAQRDPAPLAAAALLRAIQSKGIQVEGGVRIEWGSQDSSPPPPPANRTTLATLTSPPLSEIVAGILEPSQNWMTEQLVHVLGLLKGEDGSWEEGFKVEEEFLTQVVGVDSLDLQFRDGSGLSAYNLVTPRAMVQIFRYMRNSPNGEVYRLALAEPGKEGSTLRNRLPGLEGRAFGKTGTITNVNSLSGYLETRSGRQLIFSVLSNGSGLPSSLVRGGIDGVVQAAARR